MTYDICYEDKNHEFKPCTVGIWPGLSGISEPFIQNGGASLHRILNSTFSR